MNERLSVRQRHLMDNIVYDRAKLILCKRI